MVIQRSLLTLQVEKKVFTIFINEFSLEGCFRLILLIGILGAFFRVLVSPRFALLVRLLSIVVGAREVLLVRSLSVILLS